MRSIEEAEARARLDEVLEEAQRQPIAICRQAQAIAVVVPIAEYERLHGLSVQGQIQLDENDERMRRALLGGIEKQVANTGSNRRHVEVPAHVPCLGLDRHFEAALLMLRGELSVLLAPV